MCSEHEHDEDDAADGHQELEGDGRARRPRSLDQGRVVATKATLPLARSPRLPRGCDIRPVTGGPVGSGRARRVERAGGVVPVDQLVDRGRASPGVGELAGRAARAARGCRSPATARDRAGAGRARRPGRRAARSRAWRTTSRAPPERGATTGTPLAAGLAQRVAAGLLLAGVHQHVEGRQCGGQVAGLEGAGELRVGQPGARASARCGPSPTTTSRMPGTWASSTRRRTPWRLAQAADVPDHDERPGGRAGPRPAVVQPGVAQLRAERRGVDARRPQAGSTPTSASRRRIQADGHQQPVGAAGDLVRQRSAAASGRRLLHDEGRDPEPARRA